MERISKDWELDFLKPDSKRLSCAAGYSCRGLEIGANYRLPQFESPAGYRFWDGLCLVCIREKVFEKYLEGVMGDNGLEEIVQPWANIPGEYHMDSFIIPPTHSLHDECVFVGIVAPFFRIPISKYWVDEETGLICQGEEYDEDRLHNVIFGETTMKSKKYDERRYPGLHDASFLILSSALIKPVSRTEPILIHLLHHVLFNNAIKTEAWRNELWVKEVVLNHVKGIYPWSAQGCSKLKGDFSIRLAISEAVVFFVSDDVTLERIIERSNETWTLFKNSVITNSNHYRLTGEIKEPEYLKPVYVNFWDRSFERFKNKQIDESSLDVTKARLGTTILKYYYEKNPMNARAEEQCVSDVCKVLRWRRFNYANRQIPLPSNLHAPNIEHFYICKHCEVIKAITEVGNEAANKRRKKKMKNSSKKVIRKQGANDVYWNFLTNTCHCFRKRSGGRRAEMNFYKRGKLGSFNCERMVESVEFGRNIVNVKNIAHVCCLRCSFVCYLNGYWILNGNLCKRCADSSETHRICEVCSTRRNEKSKSANWFSVDVMVDSGVGEVERRYICGKHKHLNILRDQKIWSAPALDMILYQQSLH